MHRKAEEEAASGANGDDENAARRRLATEIGSEFVARDTSVPSTRSFDGCPGTAAGSVSGDLDDPESARGSILD